MENKYILSGNPHSGRSRILKVSPINNVESKFSESQKYAICRLLSSIQADSFFVADPECKRRDQYYEDLQNKITSLLQKLRNNLPDDDVQSIIQELRRQAKSIYLHHSKEAYNEFVKIFFSSTRKIMKFIS